MGGKIHLVDQCHEVLKTGVKPQSNNNNNNNKPAYEKKPLYSSQKYENVRKYDIDQKFDNNKNSNFNNDFTATTSTTKPFPAHTYDRDYYRKIAFTVFFT